MQCNQTSPSSKDVHSKIGGPSEQVCVDVATDTAYDEEDNVSFMSADEGHELTMVYDLSSNDEAPRAQHDDADDAWALSCCSNEEQEAVQELANELRSDIEGFDMDRVFWCGDGIQRSGWLLACLRVNHMQQAQAGKVARRFAQFRRNEGWGYRISATVVEKPLRSGHHWLLPNKDCHGRSVIVQRLGTFDTSLCPVSEYQRMGCYLMQQTINSRATQLNGVTLINDLRGLTYSTMYAVSGLQDTQRGIQMWQEAFPCKLRRIFVISPSSLYKHFIDMVKSFVSQKIQNRIIVMTADDLSPLHAEIPVHQLPVEFGGNLEMHPVWDEWVSEALEIERRELTAVGPHAVRCPGPPERSTTAVPASSRSGCGLLACSN